MTGVNKIILVGNLGKDPEVRFTQSGMAICNLNLAVTERRKEGDTWKDVTEWFRVVVFGKAAENAGQYLGKGRQVYVEGKGRHTKYKDKEGNERQGFEVAADVLQYLGGTQQGEPREKRSESDKPKQKPAPADEGFIDDDLPF